MSIIEAGGRGAEITLLLLIAALLLRDARGFAAARYGALFLIGAAANAIASAPPMIGHWPLWLIPVRVLALGNPAVFWVVASALFDDEFKPSWPHLAAWLGLETLGFWPWIHYGPHPLLPENWLALACLLLALVQAMRGREGDLVEARRSFRSVFVITVGVFTAATISTAMATRGGQTFALFGLFDTFGSLAITCFFAVRLLALPPGSWFLPIAAKSARTEAAADPQEAALLARLNAEMDANRAYRDEALNIAGLAARLGVPEYRLRRLINQRLGHRNFAAFLNGYRIDEAMAALSDPSQREVPILTIALDTGYASIGPFNRAFRARTGTTPTEYRRQALA